MAYANLPISFWGEAWLPAACILNHVLDSKSDSLPIGDSISIRDRRRSTIMGKTSIGSLLRRSERGIIH